MSKFSGGTVYHFPLFRGARAWQAAALERTLTRYLTRKIGFEAVMRVRCTRGISIHTFHGNFFVRSTDLLSLPNVSPDAGFGMQLAIDESLADLQQVCFQAALLYTSSKGERRIRVHTLALPTASTLTDVLHSADQLCIVGLLSKMGESPLPPASSLQPPASCLQPPASCLLPPAPASCLLPPASCLLPPASCSWLLPPASCLQPPASSLLPPAPASCLQPLPPGPASSSWPPASSLQPPASSVDRCASASMSEAREALINVAVDALSAHRLAQNLPAGAVSAALHAPASLRLLPLYLLALLKRNLPAGAVSAALHAPASLRLLPLYLLALLKRNLPAGAVSAALTRPASLRLLPLYLLALLKRTLPAGAVSAALHAPASLRLLPLYLLALLKRVSTIIPWVAMWSMTGSDRRGWPNLPAGAVSAALHAPASLRLLPLYLLALLKSAALHAPASLRLLPLYLLALLKRNLPAGAVSAALHAPASLRLLPLYLLALLKRNLPAGAVSAALHAPASLRLLPLYLLALLKRNLPAGAGSAALHAPASLRLLPLYLLALLKRKAFRTGTSTRLDDRVGDMCALKTLPLSQLARAVYPALYPVLDLHQISVNGAYLLDDGETFIIYVCHGASPAYLSDTFGVAAFSQLPDEARALPALDSEGSELLHALLDRLNEERAVESGVLLLRSVPPRPAPPPAASAACAAECGVLLLRSVPPSAPVRRAAAEVSAPPAASAACAAEVSAPASRQCGVLLLRSVPPPAASRRAAAESKMSTTAELEAGVQSNARVMFYPLLLLASGLWFLYRWQQTSRLHKMGNKLPGPSTVPIFGNALLALGKKPNELITMGLKYGEQYGNVIRGWLGSKLIIFLMDADDVEVILNSHVHIDKASEYRFFKPWLGEGLLISSEQRQRREQNERRNGKDLRCS
ncbi:hypothetical protein MSG28_012906 [Choristoneura fumiferana]|nr:hypothetical protein MSG28_012906 [Choristoneura fumiferana]